MFFKSQPIHPALEEALTDALQEPPKGSHAEAATEARSRAGQVVAKSSGLSPQWMTFAVAAGVFLILLFGATYLAGQADAQPTGTETQLRALSKIVQDLLVGWSGAVLGLIAGEAVGKKS